MKQLVFAVVLLVCGLTAGMVITGKMRSADDAAAQTPAASAPTVSAPAAAATGATTLPDFSRIAERTVPAVANISSTQIIRRQNSPYSNDPFFQLFFGDPGDIQGGPGRASKSLGSGVIISGDGYILTNNHVVTGDQRRVSLRDIDISVSLSDKREMPGQVVGVDPDTDLALVKVNARNLPTMPWGDSSRLKVAEWVLAIGNPFQLNQTVTLGIVSATGRTLGGNLATYEDFIQTDAAINPGNSGGALVNARGELIGINTAIFSETGGYQGIGFAVPSNLARHVMQDLIKFGMVQRGTIPGITVQSLTTMIADQLGASNTHGAVVVGVQQRSD